MDDREIVRRCAEAMGYEPKPHPNHAHHQHLMWIAGGSNYNPLDDDAQAMALQKRFRMDIDNGPEVYKITIWDAHFEVVAEAQHPDLNRAICTAVANMQEAKGG